MAHHAHRLKRKRRADKRHARNVETKSKIKTLSKKLRTSFGATDAAQTDALLRAATSAIAKAAKRGIIHKRTAARRISRLARARNAAAK